MIKKVPVMKNVFVFIPFTTIGIGRYAIRCGHKCGIVSLLILFFLLCILQLSCVPVPHLYVSNQTGETIFVEIKNNSIVEIPCGKSASFQFRPGAPLIKVIRKGTVSLYRIPWEVPQEYRHYIGKDTRVTLGIQINVDGRIFLLMNGQKSACENEVQPSGFPLSPTTYK